MMSLLNRATAKLATVQGFGAGMPKREPTLSPTYLTDMLNKSDRVPEQARATAAGSRMHVSGLIGACPRSAVLQRLYGDGQAVFKSVTGFDRIVWRIGRAVEAHIRDALIQGHGPGKVMGAWTCPCRHRIFEGTFPINDPLCPVCRKERNIYLEPDLIDDEHGVQGHPDLTLIMEDGCLLVVEIKSMNANEWTELKAAKGDHRFQATMYRHLYRRMGYRVHAKVIIIVATKDYRFNRKVTPYKEYHVDATSPALQRELDDALDLAKLVKVSSESGDLPPRIGVCGSSNTATAKGCTQCVRCFNLPDGR